MGKTEIIITIFLFNVFFILFIIGIILFIRQYKLKKNEHNIMLQNQYEEHQKELLSNQIEIQKQTMQDIGREIHDNIGQKLTLASLYSQQLAYENKAPHINEKIDSISEIINQSLTELRALSKSLTDDTINSKNIIDLIQQEVDKINELKKCIASFTYNEKNIKLDYQVKSVLYRIIQEFIQNSLKHSGCKNIMINLESNHNQVKLKVEDDGIGFDINTIRSKGIGLKNMKKRAKIIHADFKIESRINKGTQLIISIPNE